MARVLGLGSVVKCKFDGVTADTVGLVTSLTPPSRERQLIDGTALDSTLAVNEVGIEDFSEFTFVHFWDPNETENEKIDTKFGDKIEREWQIIYATTVAVTDAFNGKVSALGPEEVVADGLLGRQVTVQRTGAITRS